MDLPAFQLQPLPAARFHCGCSAEALRKTALQILGREEIEKLLAENPNPALRCQFSIRNTTFPPPIFRKRAASARAQFTRVFSPGRIFFIFFHFPLAFFIDFGYN